MCPKGRQIGVDTQTKDEHDIIFMEGSDMDAKAKAQVMAQLGNPKDVDRDLQSFRRAARVFSSNHPRLIDRYAKRWVAVHRGRVRASGKTFGSVMAQVDSKGLTRDSVIVRYIDKNQRTMIL